MSANDCIPNIGCFLLKKKMYQYVTCLSLLKIDTHPPKNQGI